MPRDLTLVLGHVEPIVASLLPVEWALVLLFAEDVEVVGIVRVGGGAGVKVSCPSSRVTWVRCCSFGFICPGHSTGVSGTYSMGTFVSDESTLVCCVRSWMSAVSLAKEVKLEMCRPTKPAVVFALIKS